VKSASAGGSGHAHRDDKMNPVHTPRRWYRLGSSSYAITNQSETVQPTSPQRQAAKRKSNAKRRRRDKETE